MASSGLGQPIQDSPIMINMVQQFEFETDSLEDFERMLEVIVYTEFRHQNSEYTKLHMKKKPSSHWGDGSEYKWTDKSILQIDKKFYSIELCATYHGARQVKVCKEHTSLEDAATNANQCDKLPPTRLWVATLSDSSCGFKKGEDHYCQTKAQLINRAAHAMQCADRDKVDEFEKLRTPDWMDRGDGSVSMGFRIAKEYDGGSEVLQLSLCHVYYGK
jgi:hypothetical protein